MYCKDRTCVNSDLTMGKISVAAVWAILHSLFFSPLQRVGILFSSWCWYRESLQPPHFVSIYWLHWTWGSGEQWQLEQMRGSRLLLPASEPVDTSAISFLLTAPWYSAQPWCRSGSVSPNTLWASCHPSQTSPRNSDWLQCVLWETRNTLL